MRVHRDLLEHGNASRPSYADCSLGAPAAWRCETCTPSSPARVETHRFGDVPWEFADAEGEGLRSIEHSREGHRSYYAQRAIEVDNTTSFVCVGFRLVDTRTSPDSAEPCGS